MQLDWVAFALELVNFLVLIWILQHFLYKPVLQTIASRKAAIEKTLADADAKQATAQSLERQYRERLSDWAKEKQALRVQAHEEIDRERGQRMAALEQALDEERKRQHAVAEHQSAQLMHRLEEAAIEQGTQFTARLLTRVASPEIEAQLVTAMLEDLGRMTPDLSRAAETGGNHAKYQFMVTSAFPLTEAQRHTITQSLQNAIRQDVTPTFSEDKELLAGLRIAAGPLVLHANLREELRFFAEVAAREA